MISAEHLVEQVVDLTRSRWSEHFAALYVYGSYVRGEMDAWSDLTRRAGMV